MITVSTHWWGDQYPELLIPKMYSFEQKLWHIIFLKKQSKKITVEISFEGVQIGLSREGSLQSS